MEDLKQRVTCPQCHELYDKDASKLLPCLHTFCVECLRKLPFRVSSKSPTPKQELLASTLKERGEEPTKEQSSTDSEESDKKQALSRTNSDPVSKYIECPKCKDSCLLPDKGVDGFQTSLIISDLVSTFKSLENYGRESGPRCCHCIKSPLAVAYCFQCRYFICDLCVKMHDHWREYESHTVVPLESLQEEQEVEETSSRGLDLYQQLIQSHQDSATSSKLPTFLTEPVSLSDIDCSHHSDEKIKFYCPVCRELLCHDCYILAHRDHPTVSITDKVIADHKSDMGSVLRSFTDTFQHLDEMAGLNLNEKEALTKQVSEIKDLVVSTFDDIEAKLKMRKEELISSLIDLEREPLQKLESREQEIEKIRNEIIEARTFIEENLTHSGPTGMLSIERTVLDHVDTVSSNYENIPNLEKSPQFEFQHDSHLLGVVSSFGRITAPSLDNVVSVDASFNDTQSLTSIPLSFHSVLINPGVVDCTSLPYSIYKSDFYSGDSDTQSISRPNSTTSQSQVESDSSSVFSIPCSISAPQVSGDAIRTISGVEHPSGLTSANHLLVCEFGERHMVSIFTHQGFRIHAVGDKGEDDGKFLYPQCVAVDSGGKMYVTDSNYRLQIFDANGVWLKTIGEKGKGELQFKDPVGVAISTNRQVFVCERENNRIQVLNSDLSHHKFIGKRGQGPCEFNQPTDIAVDQNGLLYVVDSWNHRIQILSQDGTFVREIGTKGSKPGQLLSPSHVCIDPDGFIFVSELRSHRISMFTVRGDFVKCFGEKGNGLGQLLKPRGIALDLNKILYVSDYGNNRIHVFK